MPTMVLLLPVLIATLAVATSITVASAMSIVWAESGNRFTAIILAIVVSGTPILAGLYHASAFVKLFQLFISYPVVDTGILSGTFGITAAVAITGLGTSIGWRAINGDVRFVAIRRFALSLVAWNGTTFRNADLTDADFGSAILKNADLRTANLTRLRLLKAQAREFSYMDNADLNSSRILQLMDTKQGREQNFDRLNLHGIRLSNADLSDSSFAKANLEEADLRKSNLTNTNLIDIMLDKADLEGARLTGAVVKPTDLIKAKNWATVKCDYIYIQRANQQGLMETERVPKDRNRTFRPGEFVRWIEKNNLKVGAAQS